MNDLVSVIMPSYNTAKYIGESIESVINQTYSNWELIIVDDCSTDNTDEVVMSYKDERIIYLKNKINSGAAASRNRALRKAKGRWIAFLDSDDLWMPEKLDKQVSFMEENEYYFTYTNYKEIDDNGNEMDISVSGPKQISKRKMYSYCWIGCLTVMYDVKKIGLVQINNIKKNNDYAMWLKVIKKSNCFLLNEDLAIYRRGRKGSISNQKVYTMIKWHYLLFRENDKKGRFVSLMYTINNLIWGLYKKIHFVNHF